MERKFYADQYLLQHFWIIEPQRMCGIKGEVVSFRKPTVFGITRKKILWGWMFAIEPIADFTQFLRYWFSKNGSLDYDVKNEFVSLAKPVVFFIGEFFHKLKLLLNS